MKAGWILGLMAAGLFMIAGPCRVVADENEDAGSAAKASPEAPVLVAEEPSGHAESAETEATPSHSGAEDEPGADESAGHSAEEPAAHSAEEPAESGAAESAEPEHGAAEKPAESGTNESDEPAAAPPEHDTAETPTAGQPSAEDDGAVGLEELEGKVSPEKIDELLETGQPDAPEAGKTPQPLDEATAIPEAATEPTPVPGQKEPVITSPSAMVGPVLAAHNAARSTVGIGPLTWSDAMANLSQEWVNHLRDSKGCEMEHRQGAFDKGYTENLFWAGGMDWGDGRVEQVEVPPGRAVQAWVDEKADYDPANGCASGKVCGHYTQVVWSGTKEVGCAMAVCADRSQIWACSYNPPGNYVGQKPY